MLIQELREQDLNLRPSGYEPDELPDCSTPRYSFDKSYYNTKPFVCQIIICRIFQKYTVFITRVHMIKNGGNAAIFYVKP